MALDQLTKNISLGLLGMLTLCAGIAFFFVSCGIRETLPVYEPKRSCYAVEVADGPEDFVLDQWSGKPRLLISSYERRGPAKQGNIYFFDIETGYSDILKRYGEPSWLSFFKPHGMDIRHFAGITYLYVIIHDPYGHNERSENAIAIYKVTRDGLKFEDALLAPSFLWSPNDLSVLNNGDLYVTNDYKSEIDLYMSRKVSQVVYYSARDKRWLIPLSGLAFANGILAKKDKVFVAETRGNRIMEYPRHEDGSLGKGRVVAKLKGPDNLMPYKGLLIVAAHFNDLEFLAHSKSKKKISPSVVFLVDPRVKDPYKSLKTLYVDEGRQISAASTAFIYKNKLYISEIFDSRIVVCGADDLEGL